LRKEFRIHQISPGRSGARASYTQATAEEKEAEAYLKAIKKNSLPPGGGPFEVMKISASATQWQTSYDAAAINLGQET